MCPYLARVSDPVPVLPAGLPADGRLPDCRRRDDSRRLCQEAQTTSSGQEEHVTAQQYIAGQSATGRHADRQCQHD